MDWRNKFIVYIILAKEYGWTQDQVDNQDPSFIEDIITFTEVTKEREYEQAKKAKEKIDRESRRAKLRSGRYG